jgi:NAD(P)-dependent dehydrogenase (short-subunit alcohol dehydrogenase family)
VCDVTSPGRVEATVAEVVAEAGRVDVLVNVFWMSSASGCDGSHGSRAEIDAEV